MNLRVRIKNPVFWVQIILGAVATALAYAGLTAADLTTWPALWELVKNTFTNPYCLFLVASNVWSALNNPYDQRPVGQRPRQNLRKTAQKVTRCVAAAGQVSVRRLLCAAAPAKPLDISPVSDYTITVLQSRHEKKGRQAAMQIKLSDHFSYGRLLRFTPPSIIMMVISSIYSVVDGLFVSNLVGDLALSSVNIVFPVAMIVGSFGFMLGTGGSAIVARTMGEGEPAARQPVFLHDHLRGRGSRRSAEYGLRDL